MQDDNKILFTERFQKIYTHLGVLSYMYARSEGSGVQPDQLASAVMIYKEDTPSVIKLLISVGIIYPKEGLLHLNYPMFHSMTVWDLLIIAEPWIQRKIPPDKIPGRLEELKSFTGTEFLRDTFIA